MAKEEIIKNTEEKKLELETGQNTGKEELVEIIKATPPLTESEALFVKKSKQHVLTIDALTELPNLEEANFHIDSIGWEEVEREKEVRTEIKTKVEVDGKMKTNIEIKITIEPIKMLENPQGDVWEHLEGDYAGEQLFTHDIVKNGEIIKEGSITREIRKAGKELPKSWEVIQAIIEAEEGETATERFNNFVKNHNIKLLGWRDPNTGMFKGLGKHLFLRCEDRSTFNSTGHMEPEDNDGIFGYSARCIQA